MSVSKSKKSSTGGKSAVSGKLPRKVAPALAARKATAAKPVGAAERPKPVVRKTYLNKSELDGFRDILLVKRRQLVGDLHGMKEETIRGESGGNLSNMPTHMADVGTDTFEHEFTLGLLESEQSLLREIDEALQRVENSTYGICLGTGEPIPKARLNAKPWAKYTIEYTRMLEKGLIRPGGQPGRDDPEEEEETPEQDVELAAEAVEEEVELLDEEPEPEE